MKKINHWICDHNHTSPDPPPPLFLKLWLPDVIFFSRSFLIIWKVSYILKQVLVNFVVRFEQNNANGRHNYRWEARYTGTYILKCVWTSLLGRLQAQTLPDEAPPVGEIHPFSKDGVTFKQIQQFWCPTNRHRNIKIYWNLFVWDTKTKWNLLVGDTKMELNLVVGDTQMKQNVNAGI